MKKILWIFGFFLVVFFAVMGLVVRDFSYNSLGKDERIIAHFNAHRSDIEELVRRYREYVPPKDKDHGTNWNRPPEIREVLKRAGVERLDDDGLVWMPNPYSIETAKKIDYLTHHPEEGGFRSGFDINTRYASIRVKISPDGYYDRITFNYGWIWKDLFFYPEAPRLENDRLLEPIDVNGVIKEGGRVVASLNTFPPDWSRGECVLRRINANWFIRMCRAAM